MGYDNAITLFAGPHGDAFTEGTGPMKVRTPFRPLHASLPGNMKLSQRLAFRWNRLFHGVLRRTTPHTVVSWRFLLPAPSPAVRLHRKVFIRAWPTRNRLLWLAIMFYSLSLWYGFFSWFHVIRCWRRQRRFDIAARPWRQLLSLAGLALLHGIPPGFYYRYRLFCRPSGEWLDFIYAHELPHWHRVFSVNGATESRETLNNKAEFAKRLQAHGLPAVETKRVLGRDTVPTDMAPLSGENWFIKPNQGDRAMGCLRLHVPAATQNEHESAVYLLTDFISNKTVARGHEPVLASLRQRQQKQDLLVQACLQNHSSLEARFGKGELITLRVLTVQTAEGYRTLRAIMEIPQRQTASGYLAVPIDCDSGLFTMPDKALIRDSGPDGTELLQWPEISVLCRKAHALFPDLFTIGWDVAVTTRGVLIIEGNTNWRVSTFQIVSGPLLQGPLLQCYRRI